MPGQLEVLNLACCLWFPSIASMGPLILQQTLVNATIVETFVTVFVLLDGIVKKGGDVALHNLYKINGTGTLCIRIIQCLQL